MYLKMRLNILKTDETKIGRGRSEGHTTALAWTGTWWYDATSDLSFLNYSNLLLCKLNGGIDSEWRNLSCPLSFVPFCALQQLTLNCGAPNSSYSRRRHGVN